MRFWCIVLIFVGVFYNSNTLSDKDEPSSSEDGEIVNNGKIGAATILHIATGLVIALMATTELLKKSNPAFDKPAARLADDINHHLLSAINHAEVGSGHQNLTQYGCYTFGQCNVDANCCPPYKCVWNNGFGTCQEHGHVCKGLGNYCQSDKDCCYNARCHFQSNGRGMCGCVAEGSYCNAYENINCCQPYSCWSNVCKSCVPQGGECFQPGQCCNGGLCYVTHWDEDKAASHMECY